MVKRRSLPARSRVTGSTVLWEGCRRMSGIGRPVVIIQMTRDTVRRSSSVPAVDMALLAFDGSMASREGKIRFAMIETGHCPP